MTGRRSAEKTVRDIRRATRRHYSEKEKIRVAPELLPGKDCIADLSRREGIDNYDYRRWS